MPTVHTSLHCLARTWNINAALSTRGMQETGLLYVLEPGLRELYPLASTRSVAFARYAEHTNTHPFLLPLYAGILLSLEEQIACGLLPPHLLDSVKKAAPTTLSAIGDALFSGSLLPMWALGSIILVLAHLPQWALGISLVLVLVLTLFRALSFFIGLRQSMRALQWLRTLNVIDWVERIKLVNALLLAVLLCQLVPVPLVEWQQYTLGLAVLAGVAWCIGRRYLRRIWLIGIALLLVILYNQ
ncbi:MAG: PTS system mannose/fructose/sorbose family transporter subunit IID [Desulfovibrionaceae bacterium]|nr:PTS system mannose/fructose/sorbose family transporter subunit IID [Desulfovibrionaceae bacterium]